MKKKGFTLIELLAVIVILAVIALIAIPLVLKYIQTSRDEARLRSAENYLDAVEKAVVNQNMQGKKFSPNVCNVKDEKLYCDGTLLDVSIKGVKPDNSSVITFNNGKIDRVKLLYEDKIIVDNEKDILVYGEDIEILPAGLYDKDNSLLATWNELVNKYGLDVEADYDGVTVKDSGSMYAIINNNSNLNLATKVIIDNNVKKIGAYAIYGCDKLTNIIIPDSVLSIGNRSFMNCKGLEKMNLPDSITFIDKYAFFMCDKLKSINLPIELTTISNSMFYGCSSLESIYIHENITNISSNAFTWCDNLDKIVVDPENSVYDSRDNSNAIIETSSNKLIVGSNNTNIIPDSVTSIGGQAFHGRSKLKNIYINKNIVNIELMAFGKIPNLEKIEVDTQNTIYDSRDNSNAIIETTTNKLIVGCKNTVIPNTVTVIGDSAFWDSTNLEKIDIPESVKEIEMFAFYNCTGLKELNVSYGLIKIGSSAFINNISLEKIILPESLTSIGGNAFSRCLKLESIEIPTSVTSIHKFAFSGSGNLKTIYYKGTVAGAPWGATNATVISDY